jgi:sulfate permease, SulP family
MRSSVQERPASRRSIRFSPTDIVAGISVAVVLVPQSLAYAQLAGMPAYRGLFAASIPALIAAPLASSPYLQPGPTAISALLTFGALSTLATPGSDRYIELGLVLALMVGVIRIAVGLLHAGVLAYFVSEPLLVGFVPAAAIIIVASQVPGAVGTASSGGNELARAAHVLVHPSTWSSEAIAIAACVGILIVVSRHVHPLFPGVLLVLIGAILFSKLTGYDGPKIGTIHAGLPPLTTSVSAGDIPRLLVPAFVIALIGFAEASSIARTYAAIDRTGWDANREFVSQGAANVAAGFFGGFPVGASFSRSALNRLAGAKTNFSGLVTGLAVLAFIPLGFVLGPLPRAVLSATVIVAVLPLIRFDRIVEVARLSRPQLAVTLTAFVLTLALSPRVQWAIVAAIALSIAIHLNWELRLVVDVGADGPRLEIIPRGVLWFASARRLEDRFTGILAGHPETTELVIRLGGLGRIDLTGALALRELIQRSREAGLTVSVTGMPAHARRVLTRVLPDDVS